MALTLAAGNAMMASWPNVFMNCTEGLTHRETDKTT